MFKTTESSSVSRTNPFIPYQTSKRLQTSCFNSKRNVEETLKLKLTKGVDIERRMQSQTVTKKNNHSRNLSFRQFLQS